MEFVSVRTATLRGDQKINFDLYIQIGAKFIAYIRKGDSFEGKRLDRLREKKLKKMFIKPEDEQSYRDYVSQNIEQAYDAKSGKSLEARVEVIQGAQQNNTEAVLENPENELTYNQAKDGAGRYVEFLMKEEKAVQSMLNLENTDQDLAHHGVTVSTLSVALAQKLGLTDPAKVQLLALGALLHDFGHTKKTYPLFKPLNELSKEDKAEYMKHPQMGAESVQTHRHFDRAVIQIIQQHEELVNGTGFPKGLIEKNTDPLAVIVSSANDFDRMILTKKVTRAEMAKTFMIDRVGLHPLDHFKMLKAIVG